MEVPARQWRHQVKPQELGGTSVGEGCCVGVVVLPVMTGERVAAAGISEDLRLRVLCQRTSNRCPRLARYVLIVFGQVDEKRSPDAIGVAEVLLGPAAVVRDRSIGTMTCGVMKVISPPRQ